MNRSSLETPQTCATMSGVQSRSFAFSSSKPLVWAAMKSWRTQPSHSMTCNMPLNSITSVPGSRARCRSAAAAVSVRRGSQQTILSRGLAARASSIRRNSTGCAQAVLLPAMKMHSAWSTSS